VFGELHFVSHKGRKGNKDKASRDRKGRGVVVFRPIRAYLKPMPELPDITVYLEALDRRVAGQVLE